MWCPECRNEYKEGITECSDCHVSLVEELPSEDGPELLWTSSIIEEASGEKIVDLDDVGSDIDMVEAAQALAKANETIASYRPAEDKARDFMSSALTLLLVGGVGLITIILIITGVIKMSFANNIRFLSYGVMSALFILFIIIGIKSFFKSKNYKKEAEIEKVLINDIHKWFFENNTKEDVDKCLDAESENLIENEKYYKRVESIKHKIQSKFTDLDEAFLDKITDDFFHELFE